MSAGWCIAGLLAVPVALLVAWIAFAFYWNSTGSREQRRGAEVLEVQDGELLELQHDLLSALARRDAAGMAMMRHPELIAEGGVAGEDLLLPEGTTGQRVVDTSRQGDNIRISIRANETIYEYEFEPHGGGYLIRRVREATQYVPLSGDHGSPEAAEASEAD